MDPCQFLRIVIGNLAIKPTKPTSNPSSYYCKIKFLDYPPQSSTIPSLTRDSTHPDSTQAHSVSACFTLTRPDFDKLIITSNKKNPQLLPPKKPLIKIDVYSGGPGPRNLLCGLGFSGKLLGRVEIPFEIGEGKVSTVIQNGWVMIDHGGKKNKDSNQELYLSVKAYSDPRFVFEFDGEPECSPQVFQVQGNIRQPVFTCKFSFRQSNDSCLRSSSTMCEPSTSGSWLNKSTDKDESQHLTHSKERKGWSITVHDLSGSPVAAASMVTPFVPTLGSDHVSRLNPGGWLILRPGDGTWKPWGRLHAWRDRSGPYGSDGLGHRFELLPDVGPNSIMGPTGITLAQSSVPIRAGGKFSIDITMGGSPGGSPNSSFDFATWSGSGSTTSSGSEVGTGSGWWPGMMYRGFVMTSTVGGEGKKRRPVVEVGTQHVTCTEDAAAFVALAAAMELSVEACRPFSQKVLRKKLSGRFVV